MRLPKDLLSGTCRKPNVYLCDVDKTKICKLETSNMQASLKFNSYSELSFEVARVYNDILMGEQKINPCYDKIEAIRLIYLESFGYFEIQGPEVTGDGIKETKTVTAYSLEYTLSQKYLEDFYINTGEVNSVEVIYANGSNIIPVTLYNPSAPKLSLLHLALEKMPGWTIGHVDSQLKTLSRQFEVDRESIYDFLMNEVCEKFNCYITFDTINNKINVYAESPTAKFIGDGVKNAFATPSFSAIETVSVDGYKTTRWTFGLVNGVKTVVLEDTPVKDSMVEIVGVDSTWETDVFITFDSLSQEIKINYSADDIKTVLTVTYGDDCDIREVNLGLPYITDLSYFYTVDWMGQELYDAYTAYQEKCNDAQPKYTQNANEMLYYAGLIDHEENRLSLGYAEASVNETTVGTYYVRGGKSPNYYYTEVSLPSEYNANTTYYSTKTVNLTEDKVSKLLEALKKYFNKTEDWYNSFTALSDEFSFMSSYGYTIEGLASKLQASNSDEEKEGFINEFLNSMWNEIGRTPLKQMFCEPYKKVQATNIEAGWSQKDNENYWTYYPVVLLLNSIESVLAERGKKIEEYQRSYDVFNQENVKISNSLLMDNNFTKEQLIKLNAFLREDELHLDDIVETAQDSVVDSFKVKQDAMESGRIELKKISQPQLQFSMSMANIYALPEFEPIIDQFQLGKIIKVGLRSDYIKQSRLLQVDINFEDFSDFSCEFSELTALRSQSDIHADLLSQAISAGKSVATNSSYWTRGSDQAGSIQQKIDAGLLDAITSIKAMDGTQGVEIDKYGIHLKAIDPNTGEAEPEQGWITNNKFLYTDDGFKSTKSVFGKYTYNKNTYYGILAEALVGSLIVGTNIEIGNANGTMKFNEEGFSVTNGGTTFQVDPNSNQLINISSDTEDLFYIGDDGKLHITGDGKKLDISANTTISEINQTTEKIELSVKEETQRAKKTEAELSTRIDSAETSITQTNDNIELRATKEELEEYQDYVTSNYYTKEQTNEAVLDISSEEIAAQVKEVKSYVDNNYSTTSEMNAAINLKADSITSTVNKNIENIQVGGRNILQRTNVSKYSDEWKTWSSSLGVNANGYLIITPNASVTSAGAYPPKLSTLEANTEYTLSFEAFASEAITLNYIYIMSDAGNTSLKTSIALSNISNKYTHTFTTTKAYANSSIMIAYADSSGALTPFYIKNLKLEKGNKATDWTPAPEDDEAEIENLSSQITQTAEEIKSEVKATYAPIGQTKHYGTCSSAAATVAKVVSCAGFVRYTGSTVTVRFANANTAASPTLNVNNTGAAYIKVYDRDLTSTSSYNWTARSVVTFIFDGTYWRLADSGALYQTENLSSKITQTASEIRSEVSAAYATKDTLKNYSTTTEMNSAISQSANAITSTVSQQLTGYATVGQTKHYGTCSTAASTAAKVVVCSGFSLYTGATISVNFTYKNSAAAPTLNVNGTGAKYIRAYNSDLAADSSYNWAARAVVTFIYDGTYWRLSDSGALYQAASLSSRITQTADSIEAEVTRAKNAESSLSSKITLNANAITSKVNSGDFGTLIEQNYDHVKIAWNKNSNYIQFESGAMNIYTSSTHSTSTLLMKHNYQGAWYYNNGTTIGKIGTNSWSGDTSYRGLVFDLEYGASFMCWSAKDSSSTSEYHVKLIYHHNSSKDKQGLHFSCNTYADSNLYLTDDYRFISWASGGCGFNGRMTWCNSSNTNAVTINGPSMAFTIHNDVNVDIYSDVDMHGWSILNQSDARLKTNIRNTQVDALSAINQIEMKEFDWIENGEHEDIGVIAQQLQTILPDLVYEDSSTGKLSIKINKFIPYLIKSIQELTDYITGETSTFALNRGWVDPYTEEEKIAFVETNSCHNKNETLEELKKPEILIPIEQKGEDEDEQQQ